MWLLRILTTTISQVSWGQILIRKSYTLSSVYLPAPIKRQRSKQRAWPHTPSRSSTPPEDCRSTVWTALLPTEPLALIGFVTISDAANLNSSMRPSVILPIHLPSERIVPKRLAYTSSQILTNGKGEPAVLFSSGATDLSSRGSSKVSNPLQTTDTTLHT